jgi:hypothetical protein
MSRAILNDVLAHTPSGPLYHYTTQAGLIGIFKNKEIWATHTQYLNDRSEFRHAMLMMRTEVGTLLDDAATEEGSARERVLKDIQKELELPHEGTNVCVCSFSENGDSLSQWRAYGGSSGYAIGFDGARLKERAGVPNARTGAQDWVLAPCIYKRDRQIELVRALVDKVIELKLQPAPPRSEPLGDLTDYAGPTSILARYLYRYAPIMKDESFEEEKEWRLISAPLSCDRPRFDHRAGKSTIIPYYRFPLGSGSEFPLWEVKIGPTHDEARANSGLASFLFNQGIPFTGWNPPISHSKVPFRDW